MQRVHTDQQDQLSVITNNTGLPQYGQIIQVPQFQMLPPPLPLPAASNQVATGSFQQSTQQLAFGGRSVYRE